MKTEKEILLKTDRTWNETMFSPLEVTSPEVTVLKITLEPGQKLNMHKHFMMNICYVEKGILTVTCDDGQQIVAKQGTSFAEVVNKYHYGQNTGTEPVEMIVFYLGEKGTPLSADKE